MNTDGSLRRLLLKLAAMAIQSSVDCGDVGYNRKDKKDLIQFLAKMVGGPKLMDILHEMGPMFDDDMKFPFDAGMRGEGRRVGSGYGFEGKLGDREKKFPGSSEGHGSSSDSSGQGAMSWDGHEFSSSSFGSIKDK